MSRSTKPEAATKPARIEGKVAQILNARELVINVGEESGVVEGMKFAVLSESPTEIRDPETGELLDTLEREKVRVMASEVRRRVTICRTYVTKVIPAGKFSRPRFRLPDLTEFEAGKTIVETLKAQDKDFPAPLSPEESYVKIKDPVIQVLED